jgi:hypothetical protein
VLLGLGGFAAGFFPAFLLFALGGMGGGDVKLLGAVGVLAGPLPTADATAGRASRKPKTRDRARPDRVRLAMGHLLR